MSEIIKSFPGYSFEYWESDKSYHNVYRGTDIGKGGYIISNPGIYGNVALLDIASLHPNSIRAMNCFGEYTKNFTDLVDARVHIKHGEYDAVRHMFNGKLEKYLKDESTAKDLAQALKIAINSVYGLTAANFQNPFRDVRNKNNIVALRGALFMRTLQDEVENRGFKIVAIKTDSIKIADATKEIVDFCMDFAKKYGYTFEHEATYEKMCQINDADYVAKYKDAEWCQNTYGYIPGDNQKKAGKWTATGARFQHPYVFKKLFTKEDILFEDLCETKEVKSAIYLDMNEGLRDVNLEEKELAKYSKLLDKQDFRKYSEGDLRNSIKTLEDVIAENHNYIFVGRVGQFCPIKPGRGGGILCRQATDVNGNVKYDSVTGTKGYRWIESEIVQELNKEDDIDLSYFNALVDESADVISQYGDLNWFISDDPYMGPDITKGFPIFDTIESDPLPF